MANENLKDKLANERGRLVRIAEKLHQIRTSAEDAERALVTADAELKAEQACAILEERLPNVSSLEKKILTLQTTRRAKLSELDGAQAAHQLQRSIVDALDGEIKERHHNDVVIKARTKCARLAALMNESAALALDIQLDLRGEYSRPDELFTTGEHPATLTARYGMLFTLADFYSRDLTMFNQEKM